MVAELENSHGISLRTQTIERLVSYQMTVFPAPAAEAVTISFGKKYRYEIADVFHESTIANSDQNISTSHRCHSVSTMPQFLYAEIYVRVNGSPKGLEVKATFGHAPATCLLRSGSVFPGVYAVDIVNRSQPTFFEVHISHNLLHIFYHIVRYCICLMSPAILKHT